MAQAGAQGRTAGLGAPGWGGPAGHGGGATGPPATCESATPEGRHPRSRSGPSPCQPLLGKTLDSVGATTITHGGGGLGAGTPTGCDTASPFPTWPLQTGRQQSLAVQTMYVLMTNAGSTAVRGSAVLLARRTASRSAVRA